MTTSYNLANKLVNATLGNITYTSPASVYASLYSTAPTANTSGTELTGNGYARQVTTFASAANGIASSNAVVTFGACTGNNWPTVIAVGIVDASTAGNIMYFNTISGRNIQVGDSLVFGTGNITITLS